MSEQPTQPTPEEFKAGLEAFLKKNNIQVKSLEECAKSEVHVCIDRRVLPDDEEGKCFMCGKAVFFHDKFPADGPQPKKICLECLPAFSRGEQSFDA